VTRYVTLAEYFWLAEQVTGVDADTLAKAARSDLADSALHAPQAGFGDTEFYPDVFDKAAVLVCRLAWNHPLPDGNKRAAWAALVLFIDLNDGVWDPDPP
jgi:death-on-curing protein